MPQFYPTSRIYNQEQYATVLVQQYLNNYWLARIFLICISFFWFNQNTVVPSLEIGIEYGFSFFMLMLDFA